VLCTDSGSGRARELAGLTGGEAVASNRELAERSDVVVLAHKPAQLGAVAEQIGGAAKLVVSILARTTQAEVRAAYPGTPVFRVEPNTPVEVRRGVLAFAVPDAPSTPALLEQVRERFGRLGTLVDVPEPLMRIAGATGGVGPAYFRADRRGLGRRRRAPWPLAARRLDARDRDDGGLGGAAARPRHDTLALRRAVASPGGTTARGPRRARARRRPHGARAGDGRRGGHMTVIAASVRTEIADFLSALLTVYVIVIIAWIVIQFVFAFGVRMPYSRWSNAVLDFLRDTRTRGSTCSGGSRCGSGRST
jgi:pyrroline-5-carboxylate reductase